MERVELRDGEDDLAHVLSVLEERTRLVPLVDQLWVGQEDSHVLCQLSFQQRVAEPCSPAALVCLDLAHVEHVGDRVVGLGVHICNVDNKRPVVLLPRRPPALHTKPVPENVLKHLAKVPQLQRRIRNLRLVCTHLQQNVNRNL